MEVVQDVDRPDVGGVQPKMIGLCNQFREALVGTVPYLWLRTNDNLGSSILIVGSFQPKDQWVNGIIENSSYFKLLVHPKGKKYYEQGDLLQFEGTKIKELRKPLLRSMSGTPDKVLARIKTWIIENAAN
jgi:hypothetical protein